MEMKTNIAARLAGVFFLLLFPGLFIYHFLVASLSMPMILTAWWSTWSAIAAAALGPFLLGHAYRSKRWATHLPLMVLGLVVAATASYHFAYGEPLDPALISRGNLLGDDLDFGLFLESAKLLVAWTGLYCIGFFVQFEPWLKRCLIVTWVVMVLMTWVFLDPETGGFVADQRFDAPEGVASYQWFANSFGITAMMMLVVVERRTYQGLVAGLSVVTLFVLSSRSEFYGFWLICLLFVGQRLLRRDYPAIVSLLAGVALSSALLAGYMSLARAPEVVPQEAPAESSEEVVVEEAPPGPVGPVGPVVQRQLEVLSPGESASWRQRMEQLDEGWKDIKASPWLGDYAGEMDSLGYGYYIHNGLSAWRQYGLLAFLIYAGLSVAAPLLAAHHVVRLRDTGPRWNAALYVASFALLLVVATKSVYWPLPALGWGICVGQMLRTGDEGESTV